MIMEFIQNCVDQEANSVQVSTFKAYCENMISEADSKVKSIKGIKLISSNIFIPISIYPLISLSIIYHLSSIIYFCIIYVNTNRGLLQHVERETGEYNGGDGRRDVRPEQGSEHLQQVSERVRQTGRGSEMLHRLLRRVR